MTASAPPHDPRDLAPARERLREVFGYDEFRPGQAEVVASVLGGRDTLAVLPTGGGKSLCYQIPALLLDGLTVVVSPLLALMKDQVDALVRDGVAAAAVNSTVDFEEQKAILRRAATGELRLLYVAPERFSNGWFMSALRGVRVALLAIDEAHCISQWGHDFRPSYRDLGGVRARLGEPPIVALTATADPRVREDIVGRLGLREADVRIAGFDRPNLRFHAVRVRSQREKLDRIAELLEALGGEASAIVYCATRKRVESLAEGLQRRRIRCARYHAGMAEEDRTRIQDAFARDSLRIIVATNAFGLGIDKPDVRLVIHHDLPESIEAYYQEAGRAGRDGDPAECVLYFAPRDRGLREFFIELSHPTPETVLEVYRALVRWGGDRAAIDDLLDRGEDGEERPGLNAAVQALAESGLARAIRGASRGRCGPTARTRSTWPGWRRTARTLRRSSTRCRRTRSRRRACARVCSTTSGSRKRRARAGPAVPASRPRAAASRTGRRRCSSNCARCAAASRRRRACRRTSSSTTARCTRWSSGIRATWRNCST